MSMDVVLWRRLDRPGHDSCRLVRTDTGWCLEGTAVFLDDDGPARLAYRVTCDERWHSQHGTVIGWIGPREIHVEIRKAPDGVWTLDGRAVGGLEACVDLDFGFTPATNAFQLRRLGLMPGQAADAPAAWFDPSVETLQLLPQRYERRTATTYWYESPTAGYAAELEVGPNGFTRRYPGLWISES